MTADSDRYIALQRIYKQQAANHVANVTHHMHSILQRDDVEIRVREQEVHAFCRNAASLRVLRSVLGCKLKNVGCFRLKAK